jgi:carbamoyltransferase
VIVLGYNGFGKSADLFARLYRATGIDRHLLYGHDSSAALLIDGELCAAVEEERFNREKKTAKFPVNAMRWCLDSAGLGFDDVDVFAFSWQFSDDVLNRMLDEICADHTAPVEQRFARVQRLAETHAGMFSLESRLTDFVEYTGHRLDPAKLVLVPHHIAHLMTGYYLSGGQDTAFLVSDGRAEWASSIMGEVRGGEPRVFDDLTIGARDSLASLFSVVTRYLGFVPNNDEYKVMGLAGYGKPPEHNPFLEHVVESRPDGTYRVAHPPNAIPAYYALFDQIFDADPKGREDFDFRVRVASAAQHMVEVVTAGQVRTLAARSDLPRLVFEGGLALNCVNNTKLLENSRFTEVEVSYGASDVGVALGAGLFASRQPGRAPAPSQSPYLGPSYGDQEIRTALRLFATPGRCRWRPRPCSATSASSGGSRDGLSTGRVPWATAAFSPTRVSPTSRTSSTSASSTGSSSGRSRPWSWRMSRPRSSNSGKSARRLT